MTPRERNLLRRSTESSMRRQVHEEKHSKLDQKKVKHFEYRRTRVLADGRQLIDVACGFCKEVCFSTGTNGVVSTFY